MSRGQWMATGGRELYHEWLVDLIDWRAEDADDDYVDISVSGGEDVALSNLRNFATQLNKKIIGTREPHAGEDMHILMRQADQIKYYTSADDMLGESSNWPKAIEKHARDGLEFAGKVSLGLACDAYQSAGGSVSNTTEFYENLSTIMHAPSFHRALEKFATTGFSVLTNNVSRAMLREDMPFVVSQILGLSLSPTAKIVHAVRENDGSLTYRLDPRVSEKLLEHLREQNKTHAVRKVGSYTIHQRLAGHRSFTTGCPVRRAPVSEQEKGNGKSAIALFSDFIGDELVRVVGDRIRSKRDIAALALDNASAS